MGTRRNELATEKAGNREGWQPRRLATEKAGNREGWQPRRLATEKAGNRRLAGRLRSRDAWQVGGAVIADVNTRERR
jgi:hypothetical protein